MREPMAGNPPGPTTDGDPESRSFRQDDRVLVVLGSLFVLLQLVYWTSDERVASVAFIVMRVAAVVTFAWGVARARPGFRRDWGLMLAGIKDRLPGNPHLAASLEWSAPIARFSASGVSPVGVPAGGLPGSGRVVVGSSGRVTVPA